MVSYMCSGQQGRRAPGRYRTDVPSIPYHPRAAAFPVPGSPARRSFCEQLGRLHSKFQGGSMVTLPIAPHFDEQHDRSLRRRVVPSSKVIYCYMYTTTNSCRYETPDRSRSLNHSQGCGVKLSAPPRDSPATPLEAAPHCQGSSDGMGGWVGSSDLGSLERGSRTAPPGL